MHFDIDLSHILHTQFAGRKRVLLFPFEEQYKLYRKPFEVLSLADFSHYYSETEPDYEKFPALKHAKGMTLFLDMGIHYLCLQVTGIIWNILTVVLR